MLFVIDTVSFIAAVVFDVQREAFHLHLQVVCTLAERIFSCKEFVVCHRQLKHDCFVLGKDVDGIFETVCAEHTHICDQEDMIESHLPK